MGKIHFDECFLNGAFAPAIPLDYCRFKGYAFQLRHIQHYLPGGSAELAAVMSAAIARRASLRS